MQQLDYLGSFFTADVYYFEEIIIFNYDFDAKCVSIFDDPCPTVDHKFSVGLLNTSANANWVCCGRTVVNFQFTDDVKIKIYRLVGIMAKEER